MRQVIKFDAVIIGFGKGGKTLANALGVSGKKTALIERSSEMYGGIYYNRLLVKPTKSAVSYMPEATYELPYEGVKEMLLVDDVDSREYLTNLFNAMYDELPEPKKRK